MCISAPWLQTTPRIVPGGCEWVSLQVPMWRQRVRHDWELNKSNNVKAQEREGNGWALLALGKIDAAPEAADSWPLLPSFTGKKPCLLACWVSMFGISKVQSKWGNGSEHWKPLVHCLEYFPGYVDEWWVKILQGGPLPGSKSGSYLLLLFSC